jgi:transglutaminase-like putative cysteine protease
MAVFKIHHATLYEYDRPVKESVNQVRIFPVADHQQRVLQFALNITNDPPVETYADYYGNQVGDFSLVQPHTSLHIETTTIVETTFNQPGNFPPVLAAELEAAMQKDIGLLRLAAPEPIAELGMIDYILSQVRNDRGDLLQQIWDCSEFVYAHFRYEKGITNVETTLDEILHHRSGVCQDFAHVTLQLLRCLGIPARYVSGYICPNRSGLRGEGATHAWVECYHPKAGWMGIDPTNNVWVEGYHVKLAVGRDFNDCTPVKGAFKGIAKQLLRVWVSVGYEDGHVFEDSNQVKTQPTEQEGVENWQSEWLEAQQQ